MSILIYFRHVKEKPDFADHIVKKCCLQLYRQHANAKAMDMLEKANKYVPSCWGPYLPAQEYQIGKQAEGSNISRNLVHYAINHWLEIWNQALNLVLLRKHS